MKVTMTIELKSSENIFDKVRRIVRVIKRILPVIDVEANIEGPITTT